jgi:hypothetical protein
LVDNYNALEDRRVLSDPVKARILYMRSWDFGMRQLKKNLSPTGEGISSTVGARF